MTAKDLAKIEQILEKLEVEKTERQKEDKKLQESFSQIREEIVILKQVPEQVATLTVETKEIYSNVLVLKTRFDNLDEKVDVVGGTTDKVWKLLEAREASVEKDKDVIRDIKRILTSTHAKIIYILIALYWLYKMGALGPIGDFIKQTGILGIGIP